MVDIHIAVDEVHEFRIICTSSEPSPFSSPLSFGAPSLASSPHLLVVDHPATAYKISPLSCHHHVLPTKTYIYVISSRSRTSKTTAFIPYIREVIETFIGRVHRLAHGTA